VAEPGRNLAEVKRALVAEDDELPSADWPGHPVRAAWHLEEVSSLTGSERVRLRAFRRALREIEARIKLFTALPLEKLDRNTLEERLSDSFRRA
jgi:hypothetical protein